MATNPSRIYERDTDKVFMRALREHAAFASTLREKSTGFKIGDVLDVRGQVRHEGGSGSIDIVVRYIGGPVLLIENKINAAYSVTRAGQGQPERYKRSVQSLRERGQQAFSVLLAPETYLTGSRLCDLFDARVPYEALRDLVSAEERRVLDLAILQAASPYEAVADLGAGEFFSAVRKLIEAQFPDLAMKLDPNVGGIRPKKSRTVYFDVLPTLSMHPGVPKPKMSLQCWDSGARSASVKIMIPERAALSEVLPVPQTLTDIGGYLRAAKNSLGITVDTPRLETQMAFSEQADDVIEALEAAMRLQSWWNENGLILKEWSGRRF